MGQYASNRYLAHWHAADAPQRFGHSIGQEEKDQPRGRTGISYQNHCQPAGLD